MTSKIGGRNVTISPLEQRLLGSRVQRWSSLEKINSIGDRWWSLCFISSQQRTFIIYKKTWKLASNQSQRKINSYRIYCGLYDWKCNGCWHDSWTICYWTTYLNCYKDSQTEYEQRKRVCNDQWRVDQGYPMLKTSFLVQSFSSVLCHGYCGNSPFKTVKKLKAKLCVPSTLNTDLIFWRPHWIVVAVKGWIMV